MTLTRRFLFAVLGTLPLTRLAWGQAAHRLTLLHMNDFHSRHEAVDGRALSCGPDRDGCFGGSARLATAIKAQRAAAEADGRAVLLLDAGDQFQGSLFYTAHQGMAELAVMHAIGTDAMAVGNHEFDNGPETLGRFAAAARFPVLSANVDAAAEPALAGRLRPYALFDRAGLRVAVVGLTTRETLLSSSPGPNIRIGDATAALTEAATAARAAGAELVVALSHLGVVADGGLDVPGVAAIVGGHSHTLLSNVEPGALGPHPMVAPSGALVVQAGAYGRYLGRLDLDLAADGRVLAYGGECRHVGLDLPEDAAVAAVVAQYAAPLLNVRRREIAVLPNEFSVASCRVSQCAFGQFVAGTLLAAAHGADVAIMNGGGLRTGLRAGPVTLGDVLDALPFGNTLATVTLDRSRPAGRNRAWSGPRRPRRLPADGGGAPGLERPAAGWRPDHGTGGAAGRTAPGRRSIPNRHYLVATNNFIRTAAATATPCCETVAIDPYDSGPRRGGADRGGAGDQVPGADSTPPPACAGRRARRRRMRRASASRMRNSSP